MVRKAFDDTLADLAGYTVTVNRTTSQATEDKPCIATVTLPAHVLQQILTCASLHMHDHPHVPKPEVGDLAEVIARNNRDDQDYHWEMRDAIEILSARCSVAQSPDYPSNGRNKEDSVKSERKYRPMRMEMDAARRDRAEAIDAESPEGIAARWNAAGVRPLDRSKIDELTKTLLSSTNAVNYETASRLMSAYREVCAEVDGQKNAITAALKALGRN